MVGSTHEKVVLVLNILLAVLDKSFVNAVEDVQIETILSPPDDCTKKASNGDQIAMHYKGTLLNGKPFDSSYDRKTPFKFQLGSGQVIAGWEKGVPGMCAGEKRKLTIPPSLGYGDQGFGDIIPAKSTLVFEIELISINGQGREERAPARDTEDDDVEGEDLPEHEGHHTHLDTFEELDLNKDEVITRDEMAYYIRSFHEAGTEVEVEEEDSVETIVSEIFQEDDKNKDGVITKDEYMHLAGNEDMFDEDDGPKDEL